MPQSKHVNNGSSGSAPSTDWRELPENDDQELFQGFAREIQEQQRQIAATTMSGAQTTPAVSAHALQRGFHAKLHAGVRAEFHVLAGLPVYAQFGLFRQPRIYPAIVRFSNGEPDRHPDRHKEPRGLAIKVIGVDGPKVVGHEDAVTQDFLATSHSVTSAVRDAKQFIAFIRASRHRRRLPFELARHVGLREAARILTALTRTVLLSTVRSVATEEYAGTAPIKCGAYAMKFTVRPSDGTASAADPPLADPDFLRKELAERLRRGDLSFEFLLQFYVDDTRTPIEDTSVSWKATAAPFVHAARLVIPRCNFDDPTVNAFSEAVDQLSFSPWHALEDHRPLGSVMRARRLAYPASSSLRGHRPEPTSVSF